MADPPDDANLADATTQMGGINLSDDDFPPPPFDIPEYDSQEEEEEEEEEDDSDDRSYSYSGGTTYSYSSVGSMEEEEKFDPYKDEFWNSVFAKFKDLNHKDKGRIMWELTHLKENRIYKEKIIQALKKQYTNHKVLLGTFITFASKIRKKLDIPSGINLFSTQELNVIWEQLKKKEDEEKMGAKGGDKK